MQYWGTAREVEKVKPLTRSEQRTMRREAGRNMAGRLRQRADYVAALVGIVPIVLDLRAAAGLLDEIVADYTPDAEGRIAK